MKLSERLSLIKAGYNKKEIAEIEKNENVNQEPEKGDSSSDGGEDKNGTGKDPEPEPSEPEKEKDDESKTHFDDLSALYKELGEVKSTLEAIQEFNSGLDHSGEGGEDQSLQEMLNEILI